MLLCCSCECWSTAARVDLVSCGCPYVVALGYAEVLVGVSCGDGAIWEVVAAGIALVVACALEGSACASMVVAVR
jgi:hypothetical protein